MKIDQPITLLLGFFQLVIFDGSKLNSMCNFSFIRMKQMTKMTHVYEDYTN